MEKDTKVIAIGNQKGGVGKTTNTANIAAALGQMGYSVLCWDLDVNYGLTTSFDIPSTAYSGTFHVLAGEREPQDAIITNDDPDLDLPEGVHVISASRELEQLPKMLASENPFYTPHTVLVDSVKKLRGFYDFIFLDTAPNTTLPTTISSYIVADYFIISTLPEKLAIRGMENALKDIRTAQHHNLNPDLELLGVLVSGLDSRIRRAREYEEIIDNSFGGSGKGSRKFNTTISRAAAVSKATDNGKTILQTNPQHKVALQFKELGKEIVERIKSFERSRGEDLEKGAVVNG